MLGSIERLPEDMKAAVASLHQCARALASSGHSLLVQTGAELSDAIGMMAAAVPAPPKPPMVELAEI
eukprot:657481-Alexandrium_andersonii.AAC.1